MFEYQYSNKKQRPTKQIGDFAYFKEGLERSEAALDAALALEATTIEADIPIGEIVDERNEARDDGVQAIRRHLFRHKLDERVRRRQNPTVHHIVRKPSLYLNREAR